MEEVTSHMQTRESEWPEQQNVPEVFMATHDTGAMGRGYLRWGICRDCVKIIDMLYLI